MKSSVWHNPATNSAALYLHIPFCVKRCNYCDFFTVAGQENLIPQYIGALLREAEIYSAQKAWQSQHFSTIYFGGGTPSLLAPDQVRQILDRLQELFQFSCDPEITFEVNPGTVTDENLQGYAASGINRLSSVVQSFLDDELRQLERRHTFQEAEGTHSSDRPDGLTHICTNLMFALSGQRPSTWRRSLERAIALKPKHISAYGLTIENGTPLHRAVLAGRVKPMSELRQRIFYNYNIGYLEQHGYQHYEVSNYALPGYQSRHNTKYWDGSPYLGLGAAAHSFDRQRRFSNVRSISKYVDSLNGSKLPISAEENLTADTRQFEMIFLALRKSEGLQLQQFQHRFGINFLEKFQAQVDKLTTHIPPLIQCEKDRIYLTREGWLMCDSVCAEFV